MVLSSSGEWFRVEEIGKGGASGPNRWLRKQKHRWSN